MGRMRVKDMPRSQQKAVFAKMTGDGYSQRLESAEKYHRRTDLLRKKHDLAEETEDRIMDVWSDKKLTYRQKMSKIGKIKKVAAGKLAAHEKAEAAPTIVGKMREEKWKRFKKQAHLTSITEVPEGHDRSVFDATIAARKMRSDALFSHEGLLLTQAEYVEGLKNRGRKLPKGSTATVMPSGMRKRVFDSHVFHAKPKKSSYIKVNGLLIKQSVYKKALRRNARVRYPHMYGEEKKKSSLTYRQLKKKGYKLNPKSDSDKDGVPNAKDCRPLDKKKQHVGAVALAVGASYIGSKLAQRRKKRNSNNSGNQMKGRVHLYKDAYATRQEAEDVAMYLTKTEHKQDVFVFKDSEGDYNIAYNEA